MDANNIVLWFSVVVFCCVIIWAVAMIHAYNKTTRND